MTQSFFFLSLAYVRRVVHKIEREEERPHSSLGAQALNCFAVPS